MTLHLDSAEAVARFIEHIAEMIREGLVEAVSLEMGPTGRGRASVVLSDLADDAVPRRLADASRDDTRPGVGGLRRDTDKE